MHACPQLFLLVDYKVRMMLTVYCVRSNNTVWPIMADRNVIPRLFMFSRLYFGPRD